MTSTSVPQQEKALGAVPGNGAGCSNKGKGNRNVTVLVVMAMVGVLS